MRMLVTGGAGFIGSNVARLLAAKGHRVCVLDNLSSGYYTNLEFEGVEFVEGDIRDASLLQKVVRGVDTIFHLAASVGNTRSIENPVADSEINVLGTLNVLEAARHARVRKVVFSSSAGIFGEPRKLPISEDHPAEPDTPYGVSKLAAEKLCLSYAKLYSLEAVALRYFNVYGVNQRYDAYGNVIPVFVYRVLHGEPITIYGDGEQTRDFINVGDVARANYLAATAKGLGGAFNLGSGTRVTINQLAELLRSVSEINLKIAYAPPRKGDVRHSVADIKNAQKSFGFRPTVTLSQGLREHFNWARRELATPYACLDRRR